MDSGGTFASLEGKEKKRKARISFLVLCILLQEMESVITVVVLQKYGAKK